MQNAMKFDQEIDMPSNKWLSEIEIEGVKMIPSTSIIYKTKTGIGATFSEILAKRNSIIMLPHVSIIKNKHSKYKDAHKTFAVYGDSQQTKPEDLYSYLKSNIEFKKILTTPRGLAKVLKAASRLEEEGPKFNIKRDFFLLVDECHKWVKDVGYRDDMVEPMDDFFAFDNKAMVSATPLRFTDPRFVQQGFRHIKLKPVHRQDAVGFREEPLPRDIEKLLSTPLRPKHPFKKDICLYNANSLLRGLEDYLGSHPNEHYCIFLNSIEGIKGIISHLDILEDSKIYCSHESQQLLKIEKVKYDVSNEFLKIDGTNLKKYTFFTSSFFNGLDIDLYVKPTIIILSDCQTLQYSIVDPYTDVLQIIGRFRRDMYKEVVHINDYRKFLRQESMKDLQLRVIESRHAHNRIQTYIDLEPQPLAKSLLMETLERNYPFSAFIDKTGAYSPFKEDNFRYLYRIKSYYTDSNELVRAYKSSGLFNLKIVKHRYLKGDILNIPRSTGKYSPDNIKMVAEALEELKDLEGTGLYLYCITGAEQRFPIVTEAYDKLGFKELEDTGFKRTAIVRQIIKHDTANMINNMPLVDMVYESFYVGKSYTSNSIKATLQRIFLDLNIKAKAKGVTINKFFVTDYHNMGSNSNSIDGVLLVDRRLSMKQKYNRA